MKRRALSLAAFSLLGLCSLGLVLRSQVKPMPSLLLRARYAVVLPWDMLRFPSAQ